VSDREEATLFEAATDAAASDASGADAPGSETPTADAGGSDALAADAPGSKAPAIERELAYAPRLDLTRIRPDVEALAGMKRGSASEDKPHVDWLERRLRDAGAHETRREPFRFQRRPWRHVAHGVPAVGAAALGGPIGAALALATAVSLEGEAGGHSRWSGSFLPAAEGVNLTARVPAAGDAERTIVFVAHHDAAPTGLPWRLPRPRTPHLLPVQLALAVVALGCALGSRVLRAIGGGLVLVATLLGLDLLRNRIVPGANDNATGAAAALALAAAFARDPLPRTNVVLVFTDCEEVGLGGMAAWIEAHGAELDPAGTIVVGLDTLGSGEPMVVTRDGAVTAQYDTEGHAWADRGALRAGVNPPRRGSLIAPTDPIVAQHNGLRALSLVSADTEGTLGPHYHLLSDTPENVDYDSVASCTKLAAGIARVWDSAS
jgi:hypothetical protein